jgi:hypothetical protein
MNQNYHYVKKRLEEEFKWLREYHPIEGFSDVEINIYNYKEYNGISLEQVEEQYDEKEVDAFVTELVKEDCLYYAIFIIVSESFIPGFIEESIMSKAGMPQEHFFYWLLYHEYGHLIQLHEIYDRLGTHGVIEEKERGDAALGALISQLEYGKINDKQLELEYRELWFEKAADDFANEIYKIRRTTL